jgi:hypothetical protein
MALETTHEGSRFIVDFGPIPVPTALAADLEGEFQRAALAVLAKIDFRGDLRIGRLPTGTWGYIFDPGGSPPPPDDGGGVPLVTVHDHTAIMQMLIERPLPVVRELVTATMQAGAKPPKPSWDEILEMILKLLGPPVSTRRAIEHTLTIGKALEAQKLPRQATAALARINRQIDAASDIDDLLDTLRNAQRADDGTVEGLSTGLEVAQQILADGRGTIYDQSYGFYGEIGDPTVAYSVAGEDVKGAVAGGVGGALGGAAVGGIGAVLGAVGGGCAGGITGSVAGAVGKLIDWLF